MTLGDPSRLRAVADIEADRGERGRSLDGLASITGRLLRAPYAFVTLVDADVASWLGCAGPVEGRSNATRDSFCQYVIARGEALLVDDARADPLTSANPSIRSMGVVAWAGHPVRSASGQVLGTLCVVDTQPRHWDETDAATLAQLASLASDVLQLWVLEASARTTSDELSVVNVAIARGELRTRQLAELARRLSAATSTTEIATAIVELGPDVFDAAFANVSVVDEDDDTLIVHNGDGLPTEMEIRYGRISLHASTPLSDAARTGQTVTVIDDDDRATRYPQLVDDTRRVGLTTTVAVPLMAASGAIVGVLGLAWSDRTVLDDSTMAYLATTAQMCGQAIERGRLADARERFLQALQRELLPAIPDLPGLDIAARYVPARSEVGFGGDWFDVLTLDVTTTAIVIGDVCGHGVQAAARMAMIRGAINATLRSDYVSLATLIARTEQLLDHIPDPFIATVAVHIIDTDTATMHYVSAGHPPALFSEGGVVRLLWEGRRAVLGFRAGTCTPGRADFAPGATLVLLTDGLVERRDLAFDDGMAQAAAILRDSGDSPVNDLAIRILDKMGPGHADDVAVAVVRAATR